MTEIKCIVDDFGNEYLPDFTETELWIGIDEFNLTKRQEKLIMLYRAICNAENYFYSNKPTAFGNPDYSMYVGIVNGMICGLGWEYQEVNNWIIIKNGKKILLKIQKPKRSQSYWDARRDNAEVLNALGL